MNAYFCDDDWLLPMTFTAYVPADSVRCRTSGVVPPASTPVTLVEHPRYSSKRAPTARSPSTIRTREVDVSLKRYQSTSLALPKRPFTHLPVGLVGRR